MVNAAGWLRIYLMFIWPAFVLPLILGPVILRRARGDPLGTLAGWFTLKPLVATPLWILCMIAAASWQLSWPYPAFLGLIPGVGLTAFIVRKFLRVFKTDTALAWILLGADAVRWLFTFAKVLIALSPLGTHLLIALALPNAYAILALAIVARRQIRPAIGVKQPPSSATRSPFGRDEPT